MTLSSIPADARLYLKPTWFVPSPIGLADGSAARMGNGLIWFQAYELTARHASRRIARETVPVAAFETVTATLPDPLPPEAPFARISLTLPRLLHARTLLLVVTGEDKRRVLRHAQQHDGGAAAPGFLPVAALLHARDHRVQIHWSP